MKKALKYGALILCLSLVVALLLCFLINKEEKFNLFSGGQPSENTEDLVIFENGKYAYRIVYDGDDSVSKQKAEELEASLEKITSEKIDVVSDKHSKYLSNDKKEILVGNTNRTESQYADMETTGSKYVIRTDGNKIVICGGDDTSLSVAVDQFLLECTEYVSDTNYAIKSLITIPSNFSLARSISDDTRDLVIVKTKDSVSYIDTLVASLEGFYSADKIRVVDLANDMSAIFDTSVTSLVVVSDVDTVTAQLRSALDSFVDNGGHVMMLGGPAFENVSYYMSDGSIVSEAEYLDYIHDSASDKTAAMLSSVSNGSEYIKIGWGATSSYSIGNYGLANANGSQLKIRFDGLRSNAWVYHMFKWSATASSTTNSIGFWAKTGSGDYAADSMTLAIIDTDGVYWNYEVELDTEWKYYIIEPNKFKDTAYYELGSTLSSSSTGLDITKAAYVAFGVDNDICHLHAGNYEFYIGDVEFLTVDLDAFAYTYEVSLNGVAPYAVQQYPITNGATINTASNQSYITERDYVMPTDVVAPLQSVQGTGYNKNRSVRLIPLIEIKDSAGLRSGYAAWVNIYDGAGAVGYFGACSDDFYNTDGILAIAETANALIRPALLVEGGSDEYTYVLDDTSSITVGAEYRAYSDATVALTVQLYEDSTLVKTYSSDSDWDSVTTTGANTVFEDEYKITTRLPNKVVTTLTVDGIVVDRIEQTIKYWEPKPEAEREYFYVEDGHYMRDGEIVTVAGINFEPNWLLALNCSETWYTRPCYDSEIVRDELQRVKNAGFNAVSIFLYARDALDSNNTLDIINMCEEIGLYVDLAIRSRNDYSEEFLFFDKEHADNIVVGTHLYEHDNIIAYDMCWERRMGNYEGDDGFGIGRKRWNSDWEAWIIDNYGSISHAETVWGTTVLVDDEGNVRGPNDSEMNSTAMNLGMMNAYYRFMDDIVAKEFNEFRQYLKAIDSNHLLSFRMQNAGAGTREPREGSYDFQSLASTMDFMSPEAYAISGTEDSLAQVAFTAAYARYCKPDAPVIIKEWGSNSWTGSNFIDASEDADVMAQMEWKERFVELMYNAEFDGFYYWWSCSGYRAGERSDAGLFNLDGSDRPITTIIREWAPKFTSRGANTNANVEYIVVDREDYGYSTNGMFSAVKDQIMTAVAAGKRVEFVNHLWTQADQGKVYADEVMNIATTGTTADGMFVMKYVNGQIMSAQSIIEGTSNYLNVKICNTGHSVWRSGTVSVYSLDGSEGTLTKTANDRDVDYLEEIVIKVPVESTGNVVLKLEINGKAFGLSFEADAHGAKTSTTDEYGAVTTTEQGTDYTKMFYSMTAGSAGSSGNYYVSSGKTFENSYSASWKNKIVYKFPLLYPDELEKFILNVNISPSYKAYIGLADDDTSYGDPVITYGAGTITSAGKNQTIDFSNALVAKLEAAATTPKYVYVKFTYNTDVNQPNIYFLELMVKYAHLWDYVTETDSEGARVETLIEQSRYTTKNYYMTAGTAGTSGNYCIEEGSANRYKTETTFCGGTTYSPRGVVYRFPLYDADAIMSIVLNATMEAKRGVFVSLDKPDSLDDWTNIYESTAYEGKKSDSYDLTEAVAALVAQNADAEYLYIALAHRNDTNAPVVYDVALSVEYDAILPSGSAMAVDVSLNGDIGLKLGLQLPGVVMESMKDNYAVQIIKTSDGSIAKEIALKDTESYEEYSGYQFFTVNLAPSLMTDEYRTQLVDTVNGYVFADTNSYSIREYAVGMLDEETTPDASKRLLKALLNYGAYAQIYFEENTQTLANEGYAYTEAVMSSVSLPTSNNVQYTNSLNVTVDRFNFNLDSKLVLNVSFIKDGELILYSKEITAADLGRTHTFTHGGALLTVSFEDYVYMALNNADTKNNTSLINLLKAMLLYKDAAEDVFGVTKNESSLIAGGIDNTGNNSLPTYEF